MTSTPLAIKVKKLLPEARLPERQHVTDSGLDLFVATVNHSHDQVWTINFGIAVEPPAGYYCELVARSSIHKYNLWMANSVGIIDADYRGPLCMNVYACNGAVLPQVGERFGQLLLRPLLLPCVVDADLSETERGEGGFGSTGK